MSEPRNPFRMRTSEQIESDYTFLRLFGPGVLELLAKSNVWDRVQIFQSAPGGGKTSLFRLFTPSVLLALHESRAIEEYKDLYLRLKSLDVISEDEPQLLGVMLPCARNYPSLEDLNFDTTKKERLLYALLNARLTLVALRGALLLKKLHYPTDLKHLTIVAPRHSDLPSQIPIPGSGQDLFEWARLVENRVCELIDSFGPSSYEALEGQETLHSLSFLRPECILYNGVPITNKIVVMFDDAHKLTAFQRTKLATTIFDLRPSISVWIAERLEALSSSELLAPGTTIGREYDEPIKLEDFWRAGGNNKRFEKIVVNIADRRVTRSQNFDNQISSFAGSLQDSLDGTEWQSHFENALNVISARVRNRSGSTEKYIQWINHVETIAGTHRERAIAWRATEILIEREAKSQQRSFDNIPMPQVNLELPDLGPLRIAAELYIAQEFNIPYYFGISRLTTLSSSNIEQFLALAGELFEEIIAAALLKRRRSLVLPPDRQEVILKKVAKQRWEEISRRIVNGQDVKKFLESLYQLTKWDWDKGTASYAPGITGIGLTMADRNDIIDPHRQIKRPEYARLANVLSSCISHSLLEAHLDHKQGGKSWMVLYLNRWMCLHFGLPLQSGGWSPKNPGELCRWLDHGFKPPRKGESEFLWPT